MYAEKINTPALAKPAEIQQQVEALVYQEVQPVLEKVLCEQRHLVQTVQSTIRTLHDALQETKDSEALAAEALSRFSEQLLALAADRYHQPEAHHFTELFADYVAQIEQFARKFTNHYREIQKEERFDGLEEDGWSIRLFKYGKRQGRALSRWPVRMRNLYRKLLNKNPYPHRQWIYHIPLRNLILQHYHTNFSESLETLLEDCYRLTATTSKQVWQAAEQVHMQVYHALTAPEATTQEEAWVSAFPITEADETFVSVSQTLQDMSAHMESRLEALLAQTSEAFTYQYERVGTIELSVSRFSTAAVKKKKLQADRSFQEFVQGWQQTLFALYEDWRLDEEYNQLCDAMLLAHFRLEAEAERKIHQVVVPKIETAEKRIQQALDAIDQAGRAVKKTLTEQKTYIDQQLMRTLIPSTMASLYNQRLPHMLDQMQQEALQCVEELSEKKGLVSQHEFDVPTKASEINYISPRQIVSYETLPVLQEALQAVKEKIKQEITLVQKLINELGQISYFNLDSALSIYDDESDQVQKPREIAEEGLLRALKNAENIRVQLDQICQFFQKDVRQAVGQFNSRIIDLKDNDYVFEIKMRIAKAIALERTRTLKRQTVRYLKNTIPRSWHMVQSGFYRGNQMISDYQKIIGISLKTGTVSTEISDFLNATEAAVSKLPYVYQRLFSVRPLEDIAFFEERPAEMNRLEEAYQNWEKGRYASTVLVGEKGSGMTTLINFFLKNFSGKARFLVIQGNVTRQINTETGLLAYLHDIIPDLEANTLEEVVTYLQQQKKKVIFAFENLEHFYLRKVGGFQCLKRLFELISKTQKQVFWLCSCTLYAWQFLDKTTRISSYFEYIVQIENVQSQQLKEVILKRHRVSGYGILFTPSQEESRRKKFQRLSEPDQQAYLENEYFQDLNKVTAGNFSLAQLFWLRSTQQVTDDLITIESLKDIDFSFLKATPLPQMLVLHTLLLHDGLTESQFREVAEHLRLTEGVEPLVPSGSLSLIQMHDDGLITKREEVYCINPLLYRQVVALLETKNFIH